MIFRKLVSDIPFISINSIDLPSGFVDKLFQINFPIRNNKKSQGKFFFSLSFIFFPYFFF